MNTAVVPALMSSMMSSSPDISQPQLETSVLHIYRGLFVPCLADEKRCNSYFLLMGKAVYDWWNRYSTCPTAVCDLLHMHREERRALS